MLCCAVVILAVVVFIVLVLMVVRVSAIVILEQLCLWGFIFFFLWCGGYLECRVLWNSWIPCVGHSYSVVVGFLVFGFHGLMVVVVLFESLNWNIDSLQQRGELIRCPPCTLLEKCLLWNPSCKHTTCIIDKWRCKRVGWSPLFWLCFCFFNMSILLGQHVCRTKMPPKKFDIDMKKGLKKAKKIRKTIRNVFEEC